MCKDYKVTNWFGKWTTPNPNVQLRNVIYLKGKMSNVKSRLVTFNCNLQYSAVLNPLELCMCLVKAHGKCLERGGKINANLLSSSWVASHFLSLLCLLLWLLKTTSSRCSLLLKRKLIHDWIYELNFKTNLKCCLLEVDKMDKPDFRVEIQAI